MILKRDLEGPLKSRARRFPVSVVTGPRQSGKTTLCRAAFPDLPYVSLELPDVRRRALDDPRGFLREYADGAILDEVQHTPELLSYLQVDVDARPRPGRYVLTGSQHFGLHQSVAQSLAGRAAMMELLPFSRGELRAGRLARDDLFQVLWTGGYPAIHHRKIPPAEWLASYVATYVERDVRQLLNVSDLLAFQTFLRLCAGRTGQLLNLSALGSDAGITHNTARSWLGVLEASYICFRLPPYFRNVGKRLLKTPKLHFHDSGLVCYLLGIRSPDELRHHPLRGAIFESWVLSEIVKSHVHSGTVSDVTFFRDSHGLETDAVVQAGQRALLVEAKSGETVSSDAFDSLDKVRTAMEVGSRPSKTSKIVVHGGRDRWVQRDVTVLPWGDIDRYDWLAGGDDH
jgi:predicted AAA+ superfamily ATPase